MSKPLAFFALAFSCLLTVRAQQPAVVDASRINVRGQPKLNSEVVTQLDRGNKVTVLEVIPTPDAEAGEPKEWAKIKLPDNTPVWVFAPFIKEGQVAVSRLNLRAGPGENYSILGRIDRGTEVEEIRQVESWMEIAAPENAYAFVGRELLKMEEGKPAAAALAAGGTAVPSATAEAATETEAEPAQPEPAEEVQPVIAETPEETPAAPAEATAEAALPGATAVPSAAAQAATQAPDAQPIQLAREVAPAASVEKEASEPPRRIVRREGLVRPTRSIQAPTPFELADPRTERTINYLYGADIGVNLAEFRGMKVIVTGEEGLDPRWPKTPVLQLESIETAP